jgi:phage tail sheath protein FI
MPAQYLHGVEVITLSQGNRNVEVVKSAVIGLIGIAPQGAKNTPILVQSDVDAAQFGSPLTGFDIPQALNAIFEQGAGTVIVVNVFDIATHTTQVTDEVQAVANGTFKLAFQPVGAVIVKNSDGSAATIVAGVDYSIDAYGNGVALSANMADGTSFKWSYKKLNAPSVTNSHIIGSIDGGTGAYTGTRCWELAKNLFGFNPKILIAPGRSSIPAIAAQLAVEAPKFRAVYLLDAPYGTTQAQAIAGRGPAGTINFNTGDKRAYLLYPYLKAFDAATDANQDFPYSAYMAGVIAATDLAFGYWFSPSNKAILGIVGTERTISAGVNDATSDANTLNGAGITTVFNTFGTGIRTWGNRNASFPTNTNIDSFLPTVRTADVIHESMEAAFLENIDQPITKALVDYIRESGNKFIRTLVARGAIVPGSNVSFPKNLNQDTDLAAGHLTYLLDMCPPPPAERITIQSYIDIGLLQTIGA